MPVALTTHPDPLPPLFPRRKRWTREECSVLVSNGTWELEKLELVDGEVISKMGQKRPHANVLTTIMYWLADVFGREYINANTSIDVAPGDNPINEPEPDVIVLKRPYPTFRRGNPQPEDLMLVVEVSDTSLRLDLTIKALLYARAGIAEYWLLDVAGSRLIVHRQPTSSGYASVIAYSASERIAPLAVPANELLVGQIFDSEEQ